jgi:hypothetical protein
MAKSVFDPIVEWRLGLSPDQRHVATAGVDLGVQVRVALMQAGSAGE